MRPTPLAGAMVLAFFVTACASPLSSGGDAVRPLPTRSPGDGQFTAGVQGTLRIDAIDGCAWVEVPSDLASEKEVMSVAWPTGFGVVDTKPAELVNGDGNLVAREGDLVQLGGGAGVPQTPDRCGVSEQVWFAHTVNRIPRKP